MDETECMICFTHFDDGNHRPRSLPCGHTMCTKCLQLAIKEQLKKCPKCMVHYSATNINEIPINFTLEGVMKLLNNLKNAKGNHVPECPEHHLPLSHRCSTHKAWICQSCVRDDHSTESCQINTISEELTLKKSIKLDQYQTLLNAFEGKIKKSDECKKQCKRVIEKKDEEIIRLQGEVKRRKTDKLQMEEKYAIFDEKIDILKGKRISYDRALLSLMSSETFREVSRYSIEVQNEADKIKLITQQLGNEVDLMLKSFKVNSDHLLGYSKVSLRNGLPHLHVQDNGLSKASTRNFQYPEENIPPVTNGILTFMDMAWPGQEPRRIYMKMLGNTARARQHLLLVTGHCSGQSYMGLHFSSPYDQGQPGECIIICPNDAVPLLKDVTVNDEVGKYPIRAGLITGACVNASTNNACFTVYLRDFPGKVISSGFPVLVTSLQVLKYYKMWQIQRKGIR